MSNHDSIFQNAVSKLLAEIFDGPAGDEAYILNPGDPGLLRQLQSISAVTASARLIEGRSTIAAHTDHVHYGLSLATRWAAGEADPWANADWNASWQRTTVTEEQWQALRDNLQREAAAWREATATLSQWDPVAAAGAVAIVAHTAYHLGAIRQILLLSGQRHST
jgi:hypothetical protein